MVADLIYSSTGSEILQIATWAKVMKSTFRRGRLATIQQHEGRLKTESTSHDISVSGLIPCCELNQWGSHTPLHLTVNIVTQLREHSLALNFCCFRQFLRKLTVEEVG